MNIFESKIIPQNQRVTVYQDSEPALPPTGSGGLSFEFIFDFVRRRFWEILFAALLGACLGAMYFVMLPAPNTAVATVAIDTRRFQLFQQPANLGEQLIDNSAAVESQLEVLKSENIALKVIKDLRLADDPEFGRGSTNFLSGLFRSADGDSEFRRTRNALLVFEKALKVKRLGLAFVIDISFEWGNAERAAQIANAIAEAYIADQLESKYQATKQGSSWLEVRIKELRDQAAAAQKAVIEYKARNNIVESTQGRLVSDQQVTELNSQLAIARAKTAAARARVDRLAAILANNPSDMNIVDAGAEFINSDQLISRLRTQYLEAASRESQWSKKYGRDHLAAVNLRNNMSAIVSTIRSELRRVEETAKNDYELAVEAERTIEGWIQDASSQGQTSREAQVTLRDLEASAETYKSLHDHFLRRYTEAVEQQSFLYTEARVLTKAAPPLNRTYRKTLLIVAMTPFMGLFLGVGIGALREFLDRGFRTSAQIENLLGTSCLALIPSEKCSSQKSTLTQPLVTRNSAAAATSVVHPIAREEQLIRTVIDQPFSRFAEAIRSLKLAVDLNGVTGKNSVIGLTSSVPEEGKSTIAAALAQSIAQTGARTLLVDCDLRNPSLSRTLTPNVSVGILDVLSGKESLDAALCRGVAENLAFLPMSASFRVAHSSEILASAALRKLFERFRAAYDYVIVDLPPLAPVVDVRATTHLVDSYIFVVEWGRTYAAVAQHALSRAPNVYEKLLGSVLNKVDMKALNLYDGNRAGYYDDAAYGRYRYTNN